MSIEYILLAASLLILISVVSSKVSDKFAIPALLLFLTIGMLAGTEGIGGIHFDNPSLAKSIGIVALIFIIFSGGIETGWLDVRPIIGPGLLLSTVGVLFTAIILGVFSVYILKFSFLEGLLLGAIVSSTDTAAVFSILKSRRVGLKSPIKPLLEFESGSNDPMAVFLTLGFIKILTHPNTTLFDLIPSFFVEMGIGGLMGYLMAVISIFIINRLRLEYTGLYPALTISLVLLTYTLTSFLHGNGFLAVYITGIMLGNQEFLNKKTIVRFHEGLAWLMQITMFLTLGLLVFPSQIVPVVMGGLLISFVLMFIARPISIFLCLLPFRMNLNKKILISWVGLRGAVPIILATFPLLANISHAQTIFYIVFFIVLTSVLIQGTSIAYVSRLLKVNIPLTNKRRYPLEFEKTEGIDAILNDIIVPYDSDVVGKALYEIKLPPECLIVLISRQDKFIIPSGTTILEGGDVILFLGSERNLSLLQKMLSKLKK